MVANEVGDFAKFGHQKKTGTWEKVSDSFCLVLPG
jgi:hypothetical protein